MSDVVNGLRGTLDAALWLAFLVGEITLEEYLRGAPLLEKTLAHVWSLGYEARMEEEYMGGTQYNPFLYPVEDE